MMPNENEPEKPVTDQQPATTAQPPDPVVQPQENVEVAQPEPPPAEFPGGQFQKEKLARHEAAHTVVADELDCIVEWVNISPTNGKGQKTNITIPKAISEREVKVRNFDIVTYCVAGLIAEKEFDPTVGLVSEKITIGMLLGQEKAKEMDVAQAIELSWKAGLDVDETIAAADAEARKILAKRKAHYDAVVELLMADEYIERPALDELLGK